MIKVNISIFDKSAFFNCFAEQNQSSSENICLSVKRSLKKCSLGPYVIFILNFSEKKFFKIVLLNKIRPRVGMYLFP